MDAHMIYSFCKDKSEQIKESKTAYSCYKDRYNKTKLRDEDFCIAFKKPLGFLMDENGDSPSYMVLVKDLLQKICGKQKLPGKEMTFYQLFLTSYIESQNMSHGQGYLFFSNGGAWGDGVNISAFLDQATLYVLDKIKIIFFVYSALVDEYKDIVAVIENSLKSLNNLIKKKNEILKSFKMVQKTF